MDDRTLEKYRFFIFIIDLFTRRKRDPKRYTTTALAYNITSVPINTF